MRACPLTYRNVSINCKVSIDYKFSINSKKQKEGPFRDISKRFIPSAYPNGQQILVERYTLANGNVADVYRCRNIIEAIQVGLITQNAPLPIYFNKNRNKGGYIFQNKAYKQKAGYRYKSVPYGKKTHFNSSEQGAKGDDGLGMRKNKSMDSTYETDSERVNYNTKMARIKSTMRKKLDEKKRDS